MNLEEYLNSTKIEKLTATEGDKKVDFYIRPLMADGQTELMRDSVNFKDVNVKFKEAKDKGKDYIPTSEETLMTVNFSQKNTYQLWCNKDGEKLFESFDAMIKNTPSKLLDAVTEAINLHKAPQEEEHGAEKN